MEAQAPNNRLTKQERLHGKTVISELLAKGKHGSVPGMRYLIRKDTGTEHARILISVPKKTFRRAVKRNLCKRRIRESWRRRKHTLKCTGADILFMYSTKDLLTYEQIDTAISLIIEKINQSR